MQWHWFIYPIMHRGIDSLKVEGKRNHNRIEIHGSWSNLTSRRIKASRGEGWDNRPFFLTAITLDIPWDDYSMGRGRRSRNAGRVMRKRRLDTCCLGFKLQASANFLSQLSRKGKERICTVLWKYLDEKTDLNNNNLQ